MNHGIFNLDDTAIIWITTVDSNNKPENADSLPAITVFASDGQTDGVNAGDQIPSLAGSAAFGHTGTITGVSTANPCVVTSAAHGLVTGNRIRITGITGNTAIQNALNDTTFDVTKIDADTFSLDGEDGSSFSYTSGGTWNVAGLYKATFTVSEANGFAEGGNYMVYAAWQVSSSGRASIETFQVS